MGERFSDAVDAAIQGTGVISVQSGGLSAEINVVESGPVGVIVDHLRVRGCSGSIVERTDAVARTLRPSGTDLMPIEVDARLGGATLRSPVDRQRRFFEAGVTEDAIELKRHRVDEDGTRHPTDFSLTREDLGELLDGLGDALLPEEID